METYKKLVLGSLLVIALGVVLLNRVEGSLGSVLIAVGGLLLIAGMSRKRKHDKERGGDEE